MAFSDPEMMVHEYFEEQSRIYSMETYIEREMDNYKTEAVKRFYTLTIPEFAETMAVTIAFGYDNDLPEAAKIVGKLKLNEKHIYALLDDARRMFEALSEDAFERATYEYA